MDVKEFDFNKLDQKQKIMLPVAAILAVVVVWQVFAMFGGSGDSDFVTPAQQTAAQEPQGTLVGGVRQIVTTDVTEVQPAAVTQEEMAQMQNASQMRRIYTTLLQQYQIANVQRMLAETRAGIAASEANLAKQKYEKLKSENQAESMSGSAGSLGSLGGVAGTSGGQFTTGLGGSGVSEEPADVGPSEEYSLAFVGHQNGRWAAIMKYKKKHYDVMVGTRLPDGSEVMSINNSSVLIAKDMKRLLVRLASTADNMFVKPGASDEDA